jgi:hypothetical protein
MKKWNFRVNLNLAIKEEKNYQECGLLVLGGGHGLAKENVLGADPLSCCDYPPLPPLLACRRLEQRVLLQGWDNAPGAPRGRELGPVLLGTGSPIRVSVSVSMGWDVTSSCTAAVMCYGEEVGSRGGPPTQNSIRDGLGQAQLLASRNRGNPWKQNRRFSLF